MHEMRVCDSPSLMRNMGALHSTKWQRRKRNSEGVIVTLAQVG